MGYAFWCCGVGIIIGEPFVSIGHAFGVALLAFLWANRFYVANGTRRGCDGGDGDMTGCGGGAGKENEYGGGMRKSEGGDVGGRSGGEEGGGRGVGNREDDEGG